MVFKISVLQNYLKKICKHKNSCIWRSRFFPFIGWYKNWNCAMYSIFKKLQYKQNLFVWLLQPPIWRQVLFATCFFLYNIDSVISFSMFNENDLWFSAKYQLSRFLFHYWCILWDKLFLISYWICIDCNHRYYNLYWL